MSEQDMTLGKNLQELVDSLPEQAQHSLIMYCQGLADMARFYRPAPDQPTQAEQPGA